MNRANRSDLLFSDQRGSAIVEFGILAPVLIAMMLGVFQIGIAVQNYNAVRNVAADVARHAMIQFTIGQPMTASAMQTYAEDIGEDAPYLLKASSLDVSVVDVATPQVDNTIEKTITVSYQVPSILDSMGLHGPSISYERPLIVTKT